MSGRSPLPLRGFSLNKRCGSNAKTGGLEADLNLTSTQYSIVLLVSRFQTRPKSLVIKSNIYKVFFISYVIFEVPSNMMISRLRPSLYLSGLCIIWGGIAACMAAAKTYQALAGIRFVLGFIEAGFAPGVAFYLSS